MLKVVEAKKHQLKEKKKRLIKGSKFRQNGSFDFWTSCPKINCNPLLSSGTSSSKYLFYLVLWDPCIKFGNIMWKLENRTFYDQP